ncbi:UDP-glucose 6-dehydrogenase YwqF [compost metagenome]
MALWGLAFKPGTDDLREAPSLVLLDALLAAGATVQACDPVATAGVAMLYAQAVERGQLRLSESPYHVAEGADALVLVTEWKQFRQPDFARIRGLMRLPVLFDGRNIYDAKQLGELGFLYRGIGRPAFVRCMVSAAC